MSRGLPADRPGVPGGGFTSAEEKTEQMMARAKAIDELLSRNDP